MCNGVSELVGPNDLDERRSNSHKRFIIIIKNRHVGIGSGTGATAPPRAGFCWWGPGANIEDGSSLIIHWSSRSHKRSTNWANQYDHFILGTVLTGLSRLI